MSPFADLEPVHMVDGQGNFCQGNVDRIIKSSAELSAPNAPYSVISIVGGHMTGKSYLLNCLFGTKFPVPGYIRGRIKTTRGIMMSRCIGPSLLLLYVEGYHTGESEQDTSFAKQATLFVLTISDLVIVNMSVFDVDREQGYATPLFKILFQERRKLHSAGLTKILVVLRFYDGETPLCILREEVLRSMEKIWEIVNGKSEKLEDYIEVNITGLPDKRSPDYPTEVTALRKLLSNSINAKVPASSFLVNSRIVWDAAVRKHMAARLVTTLQFQGVKGREAWNQLHGKLDEAAAAIACNNTRTTVEALLEVAKDASSSEAWMRSFEEGVRKANPDLLKDLVLVVADKLNMTPLGDSEPICMVDDDSEFCEANVDRIIKSSAELSAPNAPYAVISIIGAQGSGKSYLLNRLFGTKFPEMDPGSGRSRRGIMMSRCIGPSLLLLDFEGFRRRRKVKDTTSQKQTTLFALTVSDLVIINMSVLDIGLEQAVPTLLFRIIFQERTKLPQGFTKILVVVRFYDGEPPMETLRSNVQKSLEKIWESVHVDDVKFKDYIEVNIVGLPDKNSAKFPKEVALLRKLLSNGKSAKLPASGFSLRSSLLWDTIQQNKELDIHQFYPGESSFHSKSSNTYGTSSGHVETSRSTHSNNYLSSAEPTSIPFHQLHRMTDGFSEKRLLGTGAYGMVYKGVLDNGELIAVKKLNSYLQLVEKSFMNELLNLTMVQHKNIIRLVGYCSETRDTIVEHEGKLVLAGQQERALCLEYMEGETLEKLLSDESCGLDWEARYKIIEGICHGLKHLHIGYKDPIYHLDLKPANILLDKDRIPKIGDFGLSRLLASMGTFETQTNSGTPGYMPPEYIVGHEVSQKFDVFSLGVIMIEVMAGKNAYNKYKSESVPSQDFIDQVRKKHKKVTGNWRKRERAEPMSTEALLEVEKCIKMALRCVEDNRVNRPTITEVVEGLNMIDLHPAPLPADAPAALPI